MFNFENALHEKIKLDPHKLDEISRVFTKSFKKVGEFDSLDIPINNLVHNKQYFLHVCLLIERQKQAHNYLIE